MKRIKLLSVFLISAAMLLAGCGSSSSSSDVSSSSAASGHSVAKDGADMQTNDKTMPTRKPMESGTKINMYFGDKVIPGVLNDSETAKALIEILIMPQMRLTLQFCLRTKTYPRNTGTRSISELSPVL